MISNCTCLPITPNTYKKLAKNVATAIDTSLPIKYTPARAYYTKWLEYTTYRPTLGMIAKQEVFAKKNKNFPIDFSFNEQKLKSLPSIKYLLQIFNTRIGKLYPETAKAREYIIENNRLELDSVTKSKGYNWIDRLKIFFK